MFEERFQTGDMVYARADLLSDGQVPGTSEGDVLVTRGARGMVVQVGHVEASPEISVYLVRFEDAQKSLGDPLGCLASELTQQADGELSAPGAAADASVFSRRSPRPS